MDFSIKSFDAKSAITAAKAGCIAVGVFENKKLTASAKALDHKGAISAAVKSGDISGKPGSTLLLRNLDGVAAERVLLVGLGSEESISDKHFLAAVQAVLRAFGSLGANDGVIALPFDGVKDRDLHWAIGSCVIAAHDGAYRSDSLKSKKDATPSGVRKIGFAVPAAHATAAKLSMAQSLAIANGMDLAKDLGNLPGNFC